MIPKVIVTCPVALGYQYAHSSLIRDSDIYIYLRYICINDIYIYIYTQCGFYSFLKSFIKTLSQNQVKPAQ